MTGRHVPLVIQGGAPRCVPRGAWDSQRVPWRLGHSNARRAGKVLIADPSMGLFYGQEVGTDAFRREGKDPSRLHLHERRRGEELSSIGGRA